MALISLGDWIDRHGDAVLERASQTPAVAMFARLVVEAPHVLPQRDRQIFAGRRNTVIGRRRHRR